MFANIYYFSGTGNSLVVARDISKKINGNLIPISSLIKKDEIRIKPDIVGIIFPVYHQGVPYIIKRFINKITYLKNKYIFGVCTYGDSPGITIKYLKKIIENNNGKLSLGFAVKMPYNYITPSFVFKGFYKSFKLREISIKKRNKCYDDWSNNKLDTICELIKDQKNGIFETKAEVIEHIVDFFNLRETIQKKIWLKVASYTKKTDLNFRESLRLMDYGFNYNDSCNGCKICSKICPVNNIKIVDSKPVWQHRCEQCFACLQWCPVEAIQFREGTLNGERYHHPEAEISDMMMKE